MKEKPDMQEGCDEEMKAKYINPFTDFGFKKLFGEEGSKGKAFVKAEIANYSEEQLEAYEESLKDYRDYNNTINTAILETKLDIVKNALEKGMDEDFIQDLTGVKKDKINEIKNDFKNS